MALWAVLTLASPSRALTVEWGPMAACLRSDAEKLAFHGVAFVRQPSGDSLLDAGDDDASAKLSAGVTTRFNLASAGKMFTAVAVAQLVDAGKVALGDPIGRFVPALAPATAAVTVRQLLTHSSGLGNYFTPENLGAIERARSASDLLPLVAGEVPSFPPGSRFEYSNSGFVLLGVMIERVSGERYDRYLARHVFAPAGMDSSGMDPDGLGRRAVGMTTMPVTMAAGPGAGGGGIVPRPGGPAPPQGPLRRAPEAATWGGPAGGGYSSASDMRRFFAALMGGKLTSARMYAALTSIQIVVSSASASSPERDFGLGFGVGSFEGRRWFGHNGGAPGANTEFAAFPSEGLTIAVFSDRDPPTATSLFRLIRTRAIHPSACPV